MEENKKVILTGVGFLVLIVLAIGIYFLFIHEKPKEATPVQEVAEETIPLEETLKDEEREALEYIQIELNKSDGLIRDLVKKLSSHPELSRWLMIKGLIRKFTAAVDNIANGQSPRPHIGFFTLKEEFTVIKKNGLNYIDPESYERYNLVGDVFVSLDSEGCARLYRQLTPVIQEAYRDLGYPDGDFNKTLTKAIIELLKVPVNEDDILLEKKVVSYMMTDSELENLSQAQKHLLRMGPENVQKIQSKLREMALALEISIPASR